MTQFVDYMSRYCTKRSTLHCNGSDRSVSKPWIDCLIQGAMHAGYASTTHGLECRDWINDDQREGWDLIIIYYLYIVIIVIICAFDYLDVKHWKCFCCASERVINPQVLRIFLTPWNERMEAKLFISLHLFVKQKVMACNSKAVPVARGWGGSTAAFTALAPFAVASADRRPDWTLRWSA